MLPIKFDTCLKCLHFRTVPAFSLALVTPSCLCPDDLEDDVIDFDDAVTDAFDAFVVECEGEDVRTTLLRLQHFTTSAGAALLENNEKLYISCLISTCAISRLLAARSTDQKDELDDESMDDSVTRD